jgi:hypothetical protein
MIKYRVGKTGSDSWTPPAGKKEALRKLKQRARNYNGPFRVKERGDNSWGPKRTLRQALKRVRIRLDDGKVGDMVLLDTSTPDVVLRIRVVETEVLAAPPSVGTAPLRNFHQAVFGQFKELESWGICNCRFIAGTNTWSQHAYCNAEDLNGPSMAYMDNVHKWIMQNKDKYNIHYVAWRVADHYDHIHVDFDPWGQGKPACA